ncbi:MAG TPA: hypothetical protein VEK14_03915 [Rhodomicrobium sp.]|nr:hypothetical protein [Rhodomicrobium sp.]
MPTRKIDPSDISMLSFVADRGGEASSKSRRKPQRRCFWRVDATGDYGRDCKLGTRLALEYLTFEEADRDGGGILQCIVADMPRELTGVEIAFLQMVAFAAAAGADRARRISAH